MYFFDWRNIGEDVKHKAIVLLTPYFGSIGIAVPQESFEAVSLSHILFADVCVLDAIIFFVT